MTATTKRPKETSQPIVINGVEIPPPPPCPPWCDKFDFQHRALGWDDLLEFTPGRFTGTKTCEQVFLRTDEMKISRFRHEFFDTSEPDEANVTETFDINGEPVSTDDLRMMHAALTIALAEVPA